MSFLSSTTSLVKREWIVFFHGTSACAILTSRKSCGSRVNNDICMILLIILKIQKTYRMVYRLRANAHKIQSIPGQGQNFDFAHILPIDRHYQMNKRGIVCFSKDRFNLVKIKKNYFCCRRLQNTQNLRQNRLLAKLCLHAKGMEFGENLFQRINL